MTRRRRKPASFTEEQQAWIETWTADSPLASAEAKRALAEAWAVARHTARELGRTDPALLDERQARLLAGVLKTGLLLARALGLDERKKKGRRADGSALLRQAPAPPDTPDAHAEPLRAEPESTKAAKLAPSLEGAEAPEPQPSLEELVAASS